MSESTEELTGAQKAAVVLMNMTQSQAAMVMQQLSDAEAEEIAAEIVRMRRVDASIAEQTLTEFHTLTVEGRLTSRGGRDVATELLEASFGAERATGVMTRVTSSMAGRAFEFLDEAEPAQVATLVDGELPQTIALVLAHLRPEHASACLAHVPDPLRSDVAHCIATMSTATPEAVSVVAAALKGRAGTVVASKRSIEIVGGVKPLVDIINRADVTTERALLAGLDARDPELAEEVRSRMLTFADIVRLEQRDVQQVLRGIDTEVLALALKGASESLVKTVRSNLSERNREMLDEEMTNAPPARASLVEEARAAVVRSIRELEARGDIVLHRTDEDSYVE